MAGEPAPPDWARPRGAGELSVLLVGDTNIQGRDDPASAFRHVMSVLEDASLLFGHLEGPLASPSQDPQRLDIPHKPRWRHSEPRMAEGLQAAGFAAMSCASNVTYGHGVAESTRATLMQAGITPCGAGADLEEAHLPAVMARDGVSFGFLSYTSIFWPYEHAAQPRRPGIATVAATTAYRPHPRVLEMPGAPPIVETRADPAELDRMRSAIAELRGRVDFVVISCHWGVSSSSEVTDYQREIGRAAIDAGADLVVGHHPHVIQEVEVWNGRAIFYSLGNFAFDWDYMHGLHLEGLMVRCIVSGGALVHVAAVPVRRGVDNDVRVHRTDEPEGAVILAELQRLCAGKNTGLVDDVTEIRLSDVGAHVREP